jgi:hypothetical protein
MRLNFQGTEVRSILIACTGLLLVACSAGAAEKIKVYRVPKEPVTPTVSEIHSDAGDDPAGHDHSGHDHGPPAQPKVTFTKPEGWLEGGRDEMRVVSFSITGPNGQTAQVTVTPLPGLAGRESLIVNMWRQQFGLSELTEDAAAKELIAVEIGGAPGKMFDIAGKSADGSAIRIVTAMKHVGEMSWFYKLQGDNELVVAQITNFVEFLKSVRIEAAILPDGDPSVAGGTMLGTVTSQPPPAVREGGPTWTAPSSWKEIAGGQFLYAKFIISGEGESEAVVNVSTSAGDGGGLSANVNRWLGQLGQAPWSKDEILNKVKEVATTGGHAMIVEMSGTDVRTGGSTSIVGAIVNNSGSTWFYKLMGDSDLVAAQKEAFTTFLIEVNY